MFALSDIDLRSRILGCADGPAAFNGEATRRGARVTSCDPLYRFGVDQIRGRIAATRDRVLEQTRQNADEFVWDVIRSVEHLATVRAAAMQTFLEDYESGKHQGRYVDAELPTLPFPDGAFDLAVCSHFLFLYSDHLAETFHTESALELCRVASEVRIFPLLALSGRPSPFVQRVADTIQCSGQDVSIDIVPYEFQRGGNRMMRIRRRKAEEDPDRSGRALFAGQSTIDVDHPYS
jgi:hypothetical protein